MCGRSACIIGVFFSVGEDSHPRHLGHGFGCKPWCLTQVVQLSCRKKHVSFLVKVSQSVHVIFSASLMGCCSVIKGDNPKCHGWFLENAALGRIKWCVFWHRRSNEANISLAWMVIGCRLWSSRTYCDVLCQQVLICFDMPWYLLQQTLGYCKVSCVGCLHWKLAMLYASSLYWAAVNLWTPNFWFQRFATKHGECFESSLLLPVLWMEVVLLVCNPF